MLHRLICKTATSLFVGYSANHSLGAFCSTWYCIINIAALWVARNNALKAQGSFKGVEKETVLKPSEALRLRKVSLYWFLNVVFLFEKAADVLSIGKEGLVQ